MDEKLTAEAERLLPGEAKRLIKAYPQAEEIRLRLGRTPSAAFCGREETIAGLEKVTRGYMERVLEAATGASVHSAWGISQGYVCAPGGIRIGVAGTAVTHSGEVTGIRDISSLCIRLPRSVRCIDEELYSRLFGDGLCSVLVTAPPGGGKTTFLRDMIRLVSDRLSAVALADERGEVCGMSRDGPSFNLGGRTDVLTGTPKAKGAMMLLRSMAPKVIAMDELTDREDTATCREITGCGTELFATVHGTGVSDLRRREAGRQLLDGMFQKAVIITREGGRRKYEVTDIC